jgi:hypothetical protein
MRQRRLEAAIIPSLAMKRRLRSRSSALLLVLASSYPAAACPKCALGEQVRAAVWQDTFWQNLIVASVPFLIATALCLNANAIGRWLGSGPR